MHLFSMRSKRKKVIRMISNYAKYSVVLKELMESEQVSPLLDRSLSTYPLYAPTKIYDLIPTREQLNQRLLNHYKYREIGFETVGRFLDELEITMNEIMPLYNERFKTIEIMAELENPFDNVDITETFQEETSSEGSGEMSGTGSTTSEASGTGKTTSQSSEESETTIQSEQDSKKVHSATPQNTLTITAAEIDSIPFADDVEWNKDHRSETGSASSESSGEVNNTDSQESSSTSQTQTETSDRRSGQTSHTLHRKGNHGVNTYAHDMNEFRTSIIDVVNEIITDKRIAELFMLVF